MKWALTIEQRRYLEQLQAGAWLRYDRHGTPTGDPVVVLRHRGGQDEPVGLRAFAELVHDGLVGHAPAGSDDAVRCYLASEDGIAALERLEAHEKEAAR
jgi:hypothetical protein